MAVCIHLDQIRLTGPPGPVTMSVTRRTLIEMPNDRYSM
jgi:hypothetical protein